MARFLAGAAACFLLLTGVFLFWQSRAAQTPLLPEAPPARMAGPALVAQNSLPPPEATPKSREEKRFSRADKDKNGRIEREELLASRRKAFAKLDKNGNGSLSFDEWAVKTIEKFGGPTRTDLAGLMQGSTRPPRRPRRRKNAVRVNSVFNPTLPA